jgi:hypothetical protein
MRKLLFLFCFATLVITACNSYGDKVKINDKSEVYYKDGASADDAQRLGNYLLKNNYFDSTNQKSVQLTKNKDTFNVKFVVDKAKVEQQGNSEFLFQILGAAISSGVFANKPVKVILADQYMKGFKDILPYSIGTADTSGSAGKDSSDTNE